MQAADSAPSPAPPAPLLSHVFDWQKLEVTPTANGLRRAVFDGPATYIVICYFAPLTPKG